ncbi:hypothetical protein AE618_08680 [Bosea vaviloviae]|uniref:Uncharacterized protein n=1 Tax=Bosea vaviloviae TaxID=1526658 RepID=A0A0N0MBV2_9HYPH|nr:hypothetical protein AE618_08680 [Bosea vaviloviae]
MSNQSYAHETIAWAKQRLDDADTIVSEVEKTAETLQDDVRKEADAALARLRVSRGKIQEIYDRLRAEAASAKEGAEQIQGALEAEWIEVESALQSYLSAARDRADTVRGVVAARAQTQRRSWEASLQEIRDRAADAVETARGELDAAIKRLSDEAEKFQARIGDAKDAGDESWEAVKSGVAEAKAVHDRTIQRIKDAFSKLF